MVETASALARVTVTEPPATGTTADPVQFVAPLLTVTWSVAEPQAAGRPLTVTLITVAPEILEDREPRGGAPWRRHGGGAKGRRCDGERRGGAEAQPGCAEKQKPKESPHHLLIPDRVPGTGSHVTTGAEKARYPLMTTLMPVTEVPVTAGAKVATMVVPTAGVVPVASPSEALAAPDRVIL